MTARVPNGTIFAIANGYGAVKAMSALSNAEPAVATLEASHGVIAGDEIEVTSGWSKVNNRVFRAGTISTNDVPLLGLNTLSTDRYPPGSGIGTIREITGWTQLQQILTVGSQGGEQQFVEGQFLDADEAFRIPTGRTAAGMNFVIADDPTLAGYLLAAEADDDRLQRAVRATLPGGSVIYYNALITIGVTPSMDVNQIMSLPITLSLQGRPTRYN